MDYILDEVERFWRIIRLKPFRKTEGVAFDVLPMRYLPRIDGIDRVIHKSSALSPGSVEDVERPWYIHPKQEDNLLVLQGLRMVDIYTLELKRLEHFVVEPERILHDGKVVYEGPAMLVWPTNVFHRIKSGEHGSVSLNFAVRLPGFDIDTNFSVYDLNTETGKFRVIREGKLDQFPE
ncbi:MAG TPA: hypothetical protein VN437_08725 [Rectinemataceae bacterium]|nr:hypothetical protein [Rectinemataceae bacterium]